MTKVTKLSQTSPLVIATGQDVLGDGFQSLEELVQMLNWAFLERSYECALSLECGTNDWDTFSGIPDGVGPLNIIFTGGAITVIRAPIYLNEDQVQAGRTFACGSMAVMQAGADAGSVTFALTGNVATVNVINTHTVATNGVERTDGGALTIASAQDVAGWADLEIRVQQTGGVSADNELSTVRFQENPPAAATNIPDPGND